MSDSHDQLGELREDIGYLKSTVESHNKDIQKLFEAITYKDQKDEEKLERVIATLDDMKDQFKAYKVVAKTIKFIGTLVLLVITFKFGDIPTLFKGW